MLSDNPAKYKDPKDVKEPHIAISRMSNNIRKLTGVAFKVYAAITLNCTKKYVGFYTFDSLCRGTNMDPELVETILDNLVERELVKISEGGYINVI